MLSLNFTNTSVVSEAISVNVDAVLGSAQDHGNQLSAVITDWSFFSLQGMKELAPSPLEIRLINDVIAAFCTVSARLSEQLLTSALSNYAFYPEFVNKILIASIKEMSFRNIDTEGLVLTYQLDESQESGTFEFHYGKNERHATVEYSIPEGWLLSQDEQATVNDLLEVIHSTAPVEAKVVMLAEKVQGIIAEMIASKKASSLDSLNRIVLAVEDQTGYQFKVGNDLNRGNYVEYSEEYGSVVTSLLSDVLIAA